MAQEFLVLFHHKDPSKMDEIVHRLPERWLAEKEAARLNAGWQDPDFGEYVVSK